MEISGVQHWIVAVARSAHLEGAAGLNVAVDAPMDEAWRRTAESAGVGQDALARLVAGHYRLQVADLGGADPHAHRLLPARVAKKYQVVALRYTDRNVVVATADPVDMEAELEISDVAGRSVHYEIAPPGLLASAVAATYPAAVLPPLQEEAVQAGPHVLVVEDDADSRMVLRAALESAGFRVEEAPDGPEAVAMLGSAEDPFDLVTLDLMMDRMHGLEVLRRIRGRMATASLPVIVATGSDDPAVALEIFDAGADDFVVKPVDPRRFILRVRAVLRRREHGFLQGFV